MGLTLVTGPVRSGKSRYVIEIAQRVRPPRELRCNRDARRERR